MKGILFLYLAGGLSASAMIEPYLKNKNPPSTSTLAGVAAAVVVLLVWNALMYKQAISPPEDQVAKSATERFTRPVAASVCFVIGLVALLI